MTSMVSWLLGAPRATSGLDALDDRYYNISNRTSRAGVNVTADSVMKAATVYRCVSLLATAIAKFPKGMHEKLTRGNRPAPEHPLDPIISFNPNRWQTAFEFWSQVCFHLVLRQNAFVQIVPGPSGRGWVGELIPLNPDRVHGPEETPDGTRRYEYTRPGGLGTVKMIGNHDIWHLHGLSSDGLRGLSMIDLAADSFGLALAEERQAARFFQRGVKFSGILQHDKTLKPETAREMSQSFGDIYGGEQGAGRIPVLWEGMKFNPVSMTSKDAEFLDSRKFSVTEIARWFGVPPHMVGDVERSTSWGTGIEQQGLHFLIYCLDAWVCLIEQAIRFSLVVQPDRYYAKFNTNALLKMDQKTQAEVLSTYIDKGIYNPNECRELLERNPRKGGDEYVNVAKPPTVAAPPSPPREPPPPDDGPQDGPQDQGQTLAIARALAHGRARELLDEEHQALARLAKEYVRKPSVWQKAAGCFYGHFAERVALTMACDKTAAKGWCETRRGLVLAEGLAGLTDGAQTQGAAALVDLALANGGSTC